MKKRGSRIVSALLAVLMVFGLVGCGEKQAGSTPEEKAAAKNYVYRMQEIETGLADDISIDRVSYVDGRIYFIGMQYLWGEQIGRIVSLYSLNMDGSDEKQVELINTVRDNPDWIDEGDESITDDPVVLPGGIEDDMGVEPRDVDTGVAVQDDAAADTEAATQDIAVPVATEESAMPVVTEEPASEDKPDEGAGDGEYTQQYSDMYTSGCTIDESGVYFVLETSSYAFDADGNYVDLGNTLELCAYTLDGAERYRTMLNEDQNQDYMYFDYVLVGKDGGIALVGNNTLMTVDGQGNVSAKTELNSTGGWTQGAFVGKDGAINLICVNDSYTKLSLKKINFTTGADMGEEELPDFLNNYGIKGGQSYDLILTNSMGMYGYNLGDADVTPVFSYINSDITSDSMGNLVEAGEGKIIATYYDPDTYMTKLAVLNHVDPADIPDKEVLTLACYYLDYNLRRRVVDFNKESELYRITIKDYSSYASMDDYTAGYTQLNNDILAGQMPDILVLDAYNMPVESYIAKGLFADISKLIEKDEELNMDDYLTNVFDAYKVDGKLYSIIPSFSIATVIGKASMVGDTPGWTMEDLQALMAKYPDASPFGEDMSRSTMLNYSMIFSGAHFVDRTSGACNFNSEEFISLLDFLTQFPEETETDDDYWMNYETQWRDGRSLLMSANIGNFRNYNQFAKGYFGEKVTPIGFPTGEGNGAVIEADSQYAISAKSGNIDGAWEFLRYYLTEEYQSSDEFSWRFPVLKSAMEKRMEEAQERPYWEDEDGNKQYYDDTWYIGGEEFVIDPMTKEEAQELYDYIISVNKAYYTDESLVNIIEEEAAAYFKGQKSAAEVADIIQSRAKIYISESR